jgi:hypothetical protein
MAADGTVSVELKLLTEKAKQQLKDFASQLAGTLGAGSSGGKGGGGKRSPVDQAGDAVDKHVTKLQKLTLTLKDVQRAFHDAWRNALPPPKVTIAGSGGGRSGGSYPGGPGSFMGPQYGGGLASGIPGLQQAGSQPTKANPVTLATMASSLVNSPLTRVAQGAVGIASGLAALRVGLGLFSFGINFALTPIRALSRVMTEAAESARNLYSRSLQSGGMPVGFTQKYGSMAKVLGVGERDVFQYGKQIAYLNNQMAYGNSVIVKYNRVLTDNSLRHGVLSNDWQALKASMGAGFARTGRAITSVKSGLVRGALAMSEWMNRLDPDIAKSKVPSPVASANRYGTSPWERMGLVLGNIGGGRNYAAITAENTAKTAQAIQSLPSKIATEMEKHKGSARAFSWGMP